MTAADRWRDELLAWAIPDHIRAAAPEFPYTMDPALFRPRADPEGTSIATDRAHEALAPGGTVLDVGCGGGAASMALANETDATIAVDQSQAMLDLYREEAEQRGLAVRTVCGNWPDVAAQAGTADVVVCHHVAYNVADLVPFVVALNSAANRRVVMELTPTHPQTSNAPLWKQFWDLDRPSGPTAADAHKVITEAGIDATLETGSTGLLRQDPPIEARAVNAARLLCLGADRLPEVRTALDALPARTSERVVIWWDAYGPSGAI